MNFHSDEYIMGKVREHYKEIKEIVGDTLIGVFAQGSVNYGMDYEGSDVDTIAIVVPTLKDMALNRSPASYVHVRENDEHIEVKDIRVFLQMLRKQNPKYLEILFTEYKVITDIYVDIVALLCKAGNKISFMNPTRAIKAAYGMMREKETALYKEYPSQKEIVQELGYAPKQFHHILRLEDYIKQYKEQLDNETYDYKTVLKPKKEEFIFNAKVKPLPLEYVEFQKTQSIDAAYEIRECFDEPVEDETAVGLLEDYSYEFLKLALKEEVLNGNC